MVCDNCYHRFSCEEMPDESGRCRNYLKDGEILFSDDLKFNPTDTIAYDYDSIKRFLDVTALRI